MLDGNFLALKYNNNAERIIPLIDK